MQRGHGEAEITQDQRQGAEEYEPACAVGPLKPSGWGPWLPQKTQKKGPVLPKPP